MPVKLVSGRFQMVNKENPMDEQAYYRDWYDYERQQDVAASLWEIENEIEDAIAESVSGEYSSVIEAVCDTDEWKQAVSELAEKLFAQRQ